MASEVSKAHDQATFAIIGFSFKLPLDISQESTLWQVLEHKANLSSKWPKSRLSIDSFEADGLYAQGGHFFNNDPGVFDAAFFSITAKEAAAMDPQQRMALEASYHAFENAGLPAQCLRGSSTAVFSATMADDYARMTSKDFDMAPRKMVTALQPSILPNRVSWYFDLRGPSVHIDTACSGTLTALDIACQTMRSGNASQALVLGSNVMLSPESSVLLAQGGFLSPDSKCFSFDARANGYARGEGIVAIVVKPFHDAVRDGDVIRAIVRGIGSNQDGRTSSLTHPNTYAQEALIRHVYAQAGLNFKTTRYFEAHGKTLDSRATGPAGRDLAKLRELTLSGTGTPVGDPIEMTAIGRVFKEYRSRDQPLYVGSVKSNIGHLEGASGGAGVIKAILALERGIIPPNALFETMNSEIDADFYNIQVPTKPIPWPSVGTRRVSVSSFGYGGTNTHVILDDAQSYLHHCGLSGFHRCTTVPSDVICNQRLHSGQDRYSDADTYVANRVYLGGEVNGHSYTDSGIVSVEVSAPRLLTWSAADQSAAKRMVASYQSYFQENITCDEGKLSQLAYTLATRRSVHPWRTYAVVGPRDTIANSSTNDVGITPVSVSQPVRAATEDISIAFVFTGQGAQYSGMGLELLQYSAFAESLRKSDAIFKTLGSDWSILDELASEQRLHQPELSQPLCTALQIALVDLLHVFDIVPTAVVGHSSGEIAAAYATDALSHESACKVAYFRGLVAGQMKARKGPSGAMIAVNLSESEAPKYLRQPHLGLCHEDVHIACVNSPDNITLSGISDAIGLIKKDLDQREVFSKMINTGIAYHTPAMGSETAAYLALMGALEMKTEKTHCQKTLMVSSVTGRVVGQKHLTSPQYWADNLVSPVRFADAIQVLTNHEKSLNLRSTIADIIEIGPHGALRRSVTQSASSPVRYHSVLERTQSPIRALLKLLGTLFCHGHPVSVLAANRHTKGSLPYLVDCPSYPFDHSRKYWSESRLSKDFRLRSACSGYMLGRASHDWNILRPRWRNWLSVEAMPWLADHEVSGRLICPGTAMYAMSIEAAIQITSNNKREISGFFCQEAHFLAPATVANTTQDATEIVLHLRPIQSTYEKQPSRYEIAIFAHHEERWTECFHTDTLQVKYQATSATQVDGGQESRFENSRIRQLAEEAVMSCTKDIDTQEFYEYCADHGIRYGDAFQLLRRIAWDGNRTSVAQIDMGSIQKRYQLLNSHAHPTVLDAAFHLMVAQLSKGLTKHIPTLVPHRITNTWTSAQSWGQAMSWLQIVAIVQPHSEGLTNPVISCYVLTDDNSPLCAIEHLFLTAISQAGKHQAREAREETLLYTISWKPQLSTLSSEQLLEICNAAAESFDTTLIEEYYVKSDSMLRLAARRGLKSLSPVTLDEAPKHIRRYVAALQHHFGTPQIGEVESVSDSEFEALLEDVENTFPDYRIFSMVSRALPSILRGETDPLELMFTTKGAESLYHFLAGDQMRDGRFKKFLDLASHETPALKILEVGAGTGSITRHILGDLQQLEKATGQSRFHSYTFTDVSSTFFEAAKHQFGDVQGRLSFQTLDLEREPADQGFDTGAYDLIVAGLVLHATSDLKATLGRARKLLRRGGYIAIHEVTSIASPCSNVTFGVLEGWWKATENWRLYTPLATEQRWSDLLKRTGFSGSDLVLHDHPIEAIHLCSMIISTAIESTATLDEEKHQVGQLVILIDPNSDRQRVLADQMDNREMEKRVLHLPDVVDEQWTISPSDVVISLLELQASRLASLSDTDFQAFQKVVKGANNLLWVSSPLVEHGTCDPYSALATGFFRSLRSEDAYKRYVTLSIESCVEGSEGSFVSSTLDSCFVRDDPSPEVEFVVRNNRLVIGRLAKEVDIDAGRLSRTVPSLRVEPWKPGQPLVLDVGTPGMLDTLRFIEDVAYDDNLRPDEVEIEAVAWPISFRDVFIALGRLGQEGMGFECAGVVTRVGNGHLPGHDVEPGDRVVMLSPGCIRTYPRASAHLVAKLPDHLPFAEAAAMIGPVLTARHSLVNVARLQSGETVLIHSGAGSTGQMAIALAQMIGAEVFATVGVDEKKSLLTSRFGIPDDHIFYSRDTSFAKGLKRLTGGRGVDVVVNSLSGDGLRASWECVAPYGRFIEIGKADIRANSSLPMGNFAKNVTFAAVDMLHICQTNDSMACQLLRDTVELFAQGELQGPGPLHMFSVSDIEKAFRYIQSGANTGRIVVTAGCKDNVPKFLVQKSTWQFDPDSTYVVAGGLGGIGRAMLRWMADKGAKHLLVLSRSGLWSGKAASEVVSDLSGKGVRIETPRCNVANIDQLAVVLRDYGKSMPAIRGCINSAMVVHDSMFENMTTTQWSEAVHAKVKVSWNLHKLLPNDMDFFISLSSLSGIYGSPGQSNYAAGCSFQDALARYRTMAGYRGSVTLDLGWMSTIGIVSESQALRRYQQNARIMQQVNETDLFATFDHYCNPSLAPLDVEHTQVLIGVFTHENFHLRGETPSAYLDRPLFATFNAPHLWAAGARSSCANWSAQVSASMLFYKASTLLDRSAIVVAALRAKLARSLGIAVGDVDPRSTPSDYGTDSLMAVELRNWIRNDFGVLIAVFEITGGNTLLSIGELVAEKAKG